MSRLVEVPPDEYDKHAFDAFKPTGDFTIDNARAMMWMAQLAYETGVPQTIATVSPLFGFTKVSPFTKKVVGLKATFDTCGIIGERPDSVVLTFAGTDPAVWQTVATDFDLRPNGGDTHAGFQSATDAAQAEIDQAIALSDNGRKPLFITGHSMGAALAALAAVHAFEQGASPTAIYVFGMPRTGNVHFHQRYTKNLGDRTYRLVHGLDVVTRVPPSASPPVPAYRHVGRLLTCASGKKFTGPADLSGSDSDDPPFSKELQDIAVSGIGALFSGNVLSPAGPGAFGPLFKFLPQPIRDHLQDSYWTALTP